jgi:iron complex outermembrane receptor protein
MSNIVLKATGAIAALATAMPAHAEDLPAVYAAKTIIVTATPNPEDPPVVAATRARLSRTPGAVSVVSNENYERRTAQGFADLLRDVPGVLVQKRFGEESRLSIRGSGIGQAYHQRGVLFAQDGVPYADADGFSDFQKINALGARYIEVYRGGNALRFGTAQLGGAINLVTPNGKTAQSPNMVRIEGGAFNTLRAGAAIARTAGQWDFHFAGNGMRSDGYRDHSEQEQARGSLNIGYSFDPDREVRLIVSGASIRQAVPGTLTLADALSRPRMANPNSVANDWRRDVDVVRGTLQTRWRFDDALVFEGGVYATRDSLWHPIPVVLDNKNHTEGLFGRFDWTGDIGSLKSDLFFGGHYRRGHLQSRVSLNSGGRPGPFLIGSGEQRAEALDLFIEGRLFVTDGLALVGGGSYGRATRDFTNNLNPTKSAERSYDWLAPRLGLLYETGGGIQLYANYTRSVEPPIYDSLVQSSFAGLGFVPLDAQTAWTSEIGARGKAGRLTFDLTAYRSRLRGEILNYTVIPGIPAPNFNAGRTVHQGIEAALDWRIVDGGGTGGSLLLRQSYTFSDFRFSGDAVYGDNRLPVVPKHQYRAELKYAGADGFFIAPAIEWRPQSVYVDYANSFKAPGYAVLSLNAGWSMGNGLDLFVDARNLTGKKYAAEFSAITNAANPATNSAIFYPGECRAVFAGLSFRY